MPASTQLTADDYTVGIICALPLEMAAVTAMLDDRHVDLDLPPQDGNSYVWGKIHRHNVIVGCLQTGKCGTIHAAALATRMQSTFPAMQFGLMVGIGAGVPSTKLDIRLGDIVVSTPTDSCNGVIQYDFGKTSAGGIFKHTGSLNKPPRILLSAVSNLESKRCEGTDGIPGLISNMLLDFPEMRSKYSFPGVDQDRLFVSTYEHPNQHDNCEACSKSHIVSRPKRTSTNPHIHYGIMGSGNQVIKHGESRDILANKFNVICIEMEAAGLMDEFPCIVIRGICDYADSHKNDVWQPYAAAAAAAYAKKLLQNVQTSNTFASPADVREFLLWLSGTPCERYHKLNQGNISPGSGEWFINKTYQNWVESYESSIFWLRGIAGCGKTKLMSMIIQKAKEDEKQRNESSLAFFYCSRSSTSRECSDPENILRSIAKQLATHGSERTLLAPADQIWRRLKNENFEESRLDVLESTDLIIQLLACQKKTLIVIDALDECDHIITLIDALHNIVRHPETGTTVKILVSSRDDKSLETNFQTCYAYSIKEGDNDTSIDRYIDLRLDCAIQKQRVLGGDVSHDLRCTIKSTLMAKAKQMWLWVALRMDLICNNTYHLEADLREDLKRVPPSIYEIYEEAFQRIECQKEIAREIARNAIAYLLAGQEPIPASIFLSIIKGKTCDASDLTRQKIEEICPTLIKYNKDLQIFEFTHASVRDFFERKEDYMVKAHVTVASSCLTLLNEACYPNPTPYNTKFTFLNYAVLYWGIHCRESGAIRTKSDTLRRLFDNFMKQPVEDHGAFNKWENYAKLAFRRCDDFNPHAVELLKIVLTKPHPLHAACVWNFPEVIQAWPRVSVFGTIRQPSLLDGCVRAASIAGNDNICDLLLAIGAPPWTKDEDGMTPLHFAASNGHVHIVKSLIKSRAEDVLTENSSNELPIHLAALNAHDSTIIELLQITVPDNKVPLTLRELHSKPFKTVRTMISRNGRASISRKDKDGRIALHKAAMRGDPSTLEWLLLAGSNIEETDSKGCTALHYAAETNTFNAVKVLLDAACRSTAVDLVQRTALHYAAERNNFEIIPDMVKSGFDLEATDMNGHTPLHLAAIWSAGRAIKTLLDLGSSQDAVDNMGYTPAHIVNFLYPAISTPDYTTEDHELAKQLLPQAFNVEFNINEDTFEVPLKFGNGYSVQLTYGIKEYEDPRNPHPCFSNRQFAIFKKSWEIDHIVIDHRSRKKLCKT